MVVTKNEKVYSLKVKILGALFLVFFVSMAGSLFGLWSYQRDKLVEMTRETAMQASFTIEAGLRHAMLHNDRETLKSTIEEMSRIADLSMISILDAGGTVKISNDSSLIGLNYDLQKSPTCLACHAQHQPRPGEAIILKKNQHFLLRSVIKIVNKPPCYGCHPAEQEICGILMVDSYLTKTYDLLRTTAKRALVTGLMTFIVIVFVILYIITRFVSQPVDAFMKGIRRIEGGDFDHWVDVRGSGEFAEMAMSFNVMSKAVGRYLEEMKGKNKEITSLYTLVQRISETIEWKKIKVIVVNLLCDIMRVENVALVIPLDGEDAQRYEIIWKRSGDSHYQAIYHLESAEAPHAILSRQELQNWVDDKLTEPLVLDDGLRALIPLQLNDMKFGLLCIGKKETDRMTVSERKLLPTLAQHIAISFANARLYEMAITDELTSLFTKRHFESKIKQMEERYRLTGEGYCVMMLDLDHFKEINDTYGHLVGDRMLVELAGLIRDNLRYGEIPCRYGGDEFVLLLPVGDIQDIRVVAERLLNSISNHVFHFDGYPPIKKSVSIGLACCPQHGKAAKELVMIADSALYEAKDKGRNQVVIWPAPRAAGQSV